MSADTTWIRLRYEQLGTSEYAVSYEDSSGATFTYSDRAARQTEWRTQPIVGGPPQLSVLWPVGATQPLLGAVAITPTWREGPYGRGPVPIAVLITAPDGTVNARWEELTGGLLETLGVSRSKYSLAFDVAASSSVQPITLPLDIALIESSSVRLRRYARQIGRGIHVRDLAITAAGLPSPVDIVVTTPRIARLICRAAGVSPLPRLLVVEKYRDTRLLSAELLPGGVSLIGLPFEMRGQGDRLLREIVAGVVHNLPLHEAVSSAGYAVRLSSGDRRDIRVLTSAEALDALRLDHLVDDVRARAERLTAYRGMDMLPPQFLPASVSVSDLTAIRGAMDQGSSTAFNFTRESFGLNPLAYAAETLDRAEDMVASVRAVGDNLARNPRRVQELETTQRRRATVWLSDADRLASIHRFGGGEVMRVSA